MQTLSPFSDMPEYAFPRLRRLLAASRPTDKTIDMSIGEPKHRYPNAINEVITSNLMGLNRYPPNDGLESLLESIGTWVKQRYELRKFDYAKSVLPLNGSREGLFNSTLSLFPRLKGSKKRYIILPNPFYQCYLAASIAANGEPIFIPSTEQTNFLPDFNRIPKNILEKTGIFFVCSPSNPHGTAANWEYWKGLINLSEKYNFRIFSDECYSEIYRHQKPLGILTVAQRVNADPEKISVFQSLSKRSNLPGMRSGFSVNGELTTEVLRKVRAYGGAPLPIPFQLASEKMWQDESHVELNRKEYNKKFEVAQNIFKDFPAFEIPKAGFFLCLRVKNVEGFTKQLWEKTGVKVLPGSYLCNLNNLSLSEIQEISYFVRVALVGSQDEIRNGLSKLRNFIDNNSQFWVEEN